MSLVSPPTPACADQPYLPLSILCSHSTFPPPACRPATLAASISALAIAQPVAFSLTIYLLTLQNFVVDEAGAKWPLHRSEAVTSVRQLLFQSGILSIKENNSPQNSHLI
ncbi:hypothetical protein KFK09_008387 [Dendrobium nobile]|uniref:Uncharacterized protein n=1 Tax=Dendrobium nobile TaxID=94219 RepID=A0A8T3BKK3_DENNO|nr:hypothetical protein KFK09_008387 [Dendrobium nobile]